jgi:hypothetical protein
MEESGAVSCPAFGTHGSKRLVCFVGLYTALMNGVLAFDPTNIPFVRLLEPARKVGAIKVPLEGDVVVLSRPAKCQYKRINLWIKTCDWLGVI